jgi:S1-C subfamily serine protease
LTKQKRDEDRGKNMPFASKSMRSCRELVVISLLLAGCGPDQAASHLNETTRSDLADSYENPVLANFNNVSRPDLVQKIVRLTIETSGGTSRCSGTMVSPDGLVLTATHCVDDVRGAIKVYPGSGGGPYRARLLERWPYETIDAAFLQLENVDRKFTYATLADHLPESGDEIYSINYPFGELNQSKGTVTAVERHSSTKNWLVTTAFVGPGSSGGTLFDSKGRQIGLSNSQDDNPRTGKVNVGSGDAVYSIVYNRWRQLVKDLPDLPSGGSDQPPGPSTDEGADGEENSPSTGDSGGPREGGAGCYDGNDRFHPLGYVFELSNGNAMVCRPGNHWELIDRSAGSQPVPEDDAISAGAGGEGCFDGNGRFHPVGKIFNLSNGKRMICRPGDRWDYL